jgi:hypothetical protein
MNSHLFRSIKAQLKGTQYTILKGGRFTFVGTKDKSDIFIVLSNSAFNHSQLSKQLHKYSNDPRFKEMYDLLKPVLVRKAKVNTILKEINKKATA